MSVKIYDAIFKALSASSVTYFVGAGVKETVPGVYDTRNWDEIRNWAKDIANKV